MTPDEIEAIRERVEAATPGPWSADPTGTVCADADLVPDGNGGEILPEGGPMEVAECYRNERPGPGDSERAANATFIAAARSDVPQLLAALAEAQRERDDWKRRLHEYWAKGDEEALERVTQVRRMVKAEADLAESQRREELMWPVVEKAQAFRHADWRTAQEVADELDAAVDTYETQEGTDGQQGR